MKKTIIIILGFIFCTVIVLTIFLGHKHYTQNKEDVTSLSDENTKAFDKKAPDVSAEEFYLLTEDGTNEVPYVKFFFNSSEGADGYEVCEFRDRYKENENDNAIIDSGNSEGDMVLIKDVTTDENDYISIEIPKKDIASLYNYSGIRIRAYTISDGEKIYGEFGKVNEVLE